MANEHTKTDWIIEDSRDDGATAPIISYLTDGQPDPEWTIASVNLCMGSESQANLKLIAAAPDMLKALQDIHDNLVFALESGDDHAGEEAVRVAIETALAATHKAGGI